VISDSVVIELLPGKDKNQVKHLQNTWYYVNRIKPELLAQIIIPDFRSIESIPEIQATAYFPGGGSWTVRPTYISRQQYTEDGLYSSDRFSTSFSFPKYLEGMLIHLEVRHNYHRPEFLKSELLRSNFATLSCTKILSMPKDWNMNYRLINPESLMVQSSVLDTGIYRTFTLRAKLLAKLEKATMPRNPENWLAAIHLSIPAQGKNSLSWVELGDHYLASINAAFKSTPELVSLATGLFSHHQDSLIRSIYALVRGRIRYHADLEIFHSFIPRSAGEVLAKGYGDCKEMSTLLVVLLRLNGIKSGIALVSTPGTVQVMEAYPSMGGFNHMIVYTEAPDGSLRFFDPTLKWGDPFDSYFELIDRSALILKDKGSFLMLIPMGSDYQNRVETKSTIQKGNGAKGWNLRGSIRLEGQCAASLRALLTGVVGEESAPLLRTYIKEMFSVEASNCKLVSTSDHFVELAYEASFNSNYLTLSNGGLLLTWPSLFGGDVRYSSVQVEGPRYVQKFEQEDTWEIPLEFEDLEKSDLNHAIGSGSWHKKGKYIHRTYGTKVSVIQPEKYLILSDYHRLRNRFVKGTLWHR
jgi:hypothetical protein